MSDAVEAALDAWFPDEDWRAIGLDLDMPTKWRAEMTAALAAADKARAVTDEEVAKILRRFFSHFHGAMPDAVAQEAVAALHAAGMKVVRHEQ